VAGRWQELTAIIAWRVRVWWRCFAVIVTVSWPSWKPLFTTRCSTGDWWMVRQVCRLSDRWAETYAGRIGALLINHNCIDVRKTYGSDRQTDTRPLLYTIHYVRDKYNTTCLSMMISAFSFSALTLLVGRQEGHLACKNWVVGCWRGCLGWGADLHMAQLMPLPLTNSCSSKSRLVLSFCCRLTRVVSDKIQEGRKMVVCMCVCVHLARISIVFWVQINILCNVILYIVTMLCHFYRIHFSGWYLCDVFVTN